MVRREREQQRALGRQPRVGTPPFSIHQSGAENVGLPHRNSIKDQGEYFSFAIDLDTPIGELVRPEDRLSEGRDDGVSVPEPRGQFPFQVSDAPPFDRGSPESSRSGDNTRPPSEQLGLRPTGRVKSPPACYMGTESHPSGTQAAQAIKLGRQGVDRREEPPSQMPDLRDGNGGIFPSAVSRALNLPAVRNEPCSPAAVNQGPGRNQRSRGYSFEKGDDKTLPLAPTPWCSQVYSLPTEGEATNQRTDGTCAGGNLVAESLGDANRDAAPMPRWHASMVASATAPDGDGVVQHLGLGNGRRASSTSTGSAIWVGAADTGAVGVFTPGTPETRTRTN